MDEEEEVEG